MWFVPNQQDSNWMFELLFIIDDTLVKIYIVKFVVSCYVFNNYRGWLVKKHRGIVRVLYRHWSHNNALIKYCCTWLII